MTDKTNPEKAAKELTILLMYLTRFNEQGRFGLAVVYKLWSINTENSGKMAV